MKSQLPASTLKQTTSCMTMTNKYPVYVLNEFPKFGAAKCMNRRAAQKN
jgi:hypothetical protein